MDAVSLFELWSSQTPSVLFGYRLSVSERYTCFLKQTLLSLCCLAGSIKSHQTFLLIRFACLHQLPAGGSQVPQTDILRAFFASRQLKVIEAKRICTGVTQMAVNNTILMIVAVATSLSTHLFSFPVRISPSALPVLFWRGKHAFV